MKTASVAQIARFAQVATFPVFFLELGFSPVQRFCTAGPITWNGFTWGNFPFALRFSPGKTAASDAITVDFPNHDNTIAGLLLPAPDSFSGLACKAYYCDGTAPATADVMEFFSGVGDSFRITEYSANLSFKSKADDVTKLPYMRIAKNAIRQTITTPGTVINWNNERYELTN